MKFFLEYLSHFSASEILHMYGDSVFRTSEELKAVDYVINFKVIFHDNHISSEDFRIYSHLQRVVSAIRIYQARTDSPFSETTEEVFRFCSIDQAEFINFIVYSEVEKEVKKINMLERKIKFNFKPVEQVAGCLIWLENALEELLNYTLRDSEEDDKVGIIIKYENCQNQKAVFPIKLKNELKSSIVIDTLTSMLRTQRLLIIGPRMELQMVRIRLPIRYRTLTAEDVFRNTEFYDSC